MKLGDMVEISGTAVIEGMEVDHRCGIKYYVRYADKDGVFTCGGYVPEWAIVKKEVENAGR